MNLTGSVLCPWQIKYILKSQNLKKKNVVKKNAEENTRKIKQFNQLITLISSKYFRRESSGVRVLGQQIVFVYFCKIFKHND